MRILVADQNALLLAAIAATFGRHCEIVTATRRDVCIEHVEQRHFDLVVACEKLAANYTGLELLSEIEAVSPATLRIFAARPETLKRLGSRLDFFGLLGTLHYPIEARKLLIALKVARGKLPGRPTPPKVKHVVLENEWDTGERLALLGQEIEDAPAVVEEPAAARDAEVVHETATPSQKPKARDIRAVHASTARHQAATHRDIAAVPATAPVESPAIEESAPEFWATPPAAIDSAAVERARHIAEASSFEVSFEVSFDENPSRFDITGHGSADASTPAHTDDDATQWLDVSFDENLNPFVTPSDKPFEESPSPRAAAAVPARVAEEEPPYIDLGAANDEAFADAPASSHRTARHDARSAPAQETPAHAPTLAASQRSPADAPASAAAQLPTAYESALAAAQRAPASASTALQPAAARASASTPQAGAPNAAARKSTPTAPPNKPGAGKSSPAKQAATNPTTAKAPRPRQLTVPTAAHREAFQRALARRNAARAGGTFEAPPIDFSSMEPLTATRPGQKVSESRSSLSDLARMATTKRPLPGMQRKSQPKHSEGNPAKRHRQPEHSGGNPAKRQGRAVGQPKRRVFVVGSGIAAVLLVGVVSFELLRANPSAEHGHHGRGANAQLFSARSSLVADNGTNPPLQVFSPPIPQSAATGPEPGTSSALPQPQTFNPDTAPPDPPPPPALEQPGPMEPPSPGHMHEPPPWVRQGGEPITQ